MIDVSGQDKQVKGYGKNNNCMWYKLGAIALRAIKSRSVNLRDVHSVKGGMIKLRTVLHKINLSSWYLCIMISNMYGNYY